MCGVLIDVYMCLDGWDSTQIRYLSCALPQCIYYFPHLLPPPTFYLALKLVSDDGEMVLYNKFKPALYYQLNLRLPSLVGGGVECY